MISFARLLVSLFLAIAVTGQTESPKAVSEVDAANHLVQRVEPVVPAIALTAKLGGKVKLHIVISVSGDVAESNYVSGPPLLMKAAMDAVKQWKYRPFLDGGTPIAVAADVEIDFPGGMTENERATRDKYFHLEDECRSLANGGMYSDAEPKCRLAVEISNALPKDAVLERIDAISMLANSIFSQRRFSEALSLYKQSLDLAKSYRQPDDADLASGYANLGRAYGVTGNLSGADDQYGKAVSTFKAAIKSLPSMYENYSRRLQRVLNEYAQLKEAEGQTGIAAELRREASAINPYVNPSAVVPSMPEPAKVLKGSDNRTNDNYVLRVAFTPDSKWLLAAWQRGNLDIWDCRTWQKIGSIDTQQGRITALAVSFDGALVATGSHGNTVRVWNIQTEKLIADFPAESENRDEFLEYLAFSPDGNLLATGGNFTKGLVLDLSSHHTVAALGATKDLVFSSDGKTLIGAVVQKLVMWSTQSWAIRKTITDPDKNVRIIVLNENTNQIALTGWKKGIRILDLDTGALVKSIPDVQTETLIFTKGWQNTVTAHGAIGIWSVPAGKVLCESPDLEVQDLALSPNGEFIAAAMHNAVGLWTMDSLGTCLGLH
jgi:WD40 repeat protein